MDAEGSVVHDRAHGLLAARDVLSMPARARSRAPVRSWANSTMATAVMTMKSDSQMARTQAVWTSAGAGSRPAVPA